MNGILSPAMNTVKSKQGSAVLTRGNALTNLLAEAVRNSGLPVQTVADRGGMSRQYLYDMMKGNANPTLDVLIAAFEATGTPLERVLDDKALYGRDKPFHDRVQTILNKKGPRGVALKVIVNGRDSDGDGISGYFSGE